MAQYWNYSAEQVQYRTDISGLRVRFGQLGGLYVTDAELVVGGFSQAENVGWERLKSSTSPSHVGKFREGPRGSYVLDSEFDATGFNGAINVNYEQLI